MKSENKGGIGNPNHDNLGRFASSSSDATTQDSSQDTQSTQQQQSTPKWIKGTANTQTQQQQQQKVPKWIITDKSDDNATNKGPSMYEKAKKNRWWHKRDIMTPDEVADNIGEFFDDNVLAFLKKYGNNTTSPLNAYGTYTSHNYVYTNAIAKQQFNPAQVISTEELNKELAVAIQSTMNNGQPDFKNIPYVDTGYLRRGVTSYNERFQDYTTNVDRDCYLTNGMYGSCVYSAYNLRGSTPQSLQSGTAGSYGTGSQNTTFTFLVNNKNGRTITNKDYDNKRQEIINNSLKIKNNIRIELNKKSLPDSVISTIAENFAYTLRNDYTFPAVLMGYDIIYDTGAKYGLILNFTNIKTNNNKKAGI